MQKSKIILLRGVFLLALLVFIGRLYEIESTEGNKEPNSLLFKRNLKISGLTHDPIIITSNSEFTSENGVINGTGSENDPYIIAHWTIDAEVFESCISISGTSVYFIIKNCTLSQCGLGMNDAGIYLYNTGNATIYNNTILYNNNYGIYLDSSNNNEISDNDCYSNLCAIYLKSSNNNEISDNDCYINVRGINLYFSNNNEISNNDYSSNYEGIYVDSSNYNQISKNNVSSNVDYGIRVYSSNNNVIKNNFFTNNDVAFYFEDDSQNWISENWIWENTYNFKEIGIEVPDYCNNWYCPPDYHDADGDGLYDLDEFYLGTDPCLVDTDNDNFLDGYEVQFGSDPLNDTNYPSMPLDWYEPIYTYLEGNATLIQKLITWANDNSTLLENVIQQLKQNATLLQQVIGWLGENATEIDMLFTYLEGNATQLIEIINYLEENATLLNTVYALATQNAELLSQLNGTLMNQNDTIQLLRDTLDKLGVSIGDIDYDGLDDLDELNYGTNPRMIDTDLDNLNDAFEIKYGTDPLDDDTDNDGSYDGVEVASGTDPLDPDDYPGKIDGGSGANTALIIGTIISIVSTVAAGILVGIFFYLKKRKAE